MQRDLHPAAIRFFALAAILGGALVLGLLFVLGSATPVDAQATCAPNTDVYQVSTAAELNDAIRCHNQSTTDPVEGYTAILMQNDIVADTVQSNSVFERITRSRLAILGLPNEDDFIVGGDFDPSQGFQISRGPAAGTAPLPLFLSEPDVELALIAVAVQMGPYDTFGVRTGQLRLDYTAFTSDSAHPDAVAVSAEQGIFINKSLIQGVPTGAQGRHERFSESVYVLSSSIASTETDLQFIGDGFGIVQNSTLAGPVGIQVDQGGVTVRGATFLGDAVHAPIGASGVVDIQGSIANICSAAEIQQGQAGPGWIDGGGNAGACFDAGMIATTAALADNGCEMSTPIGCPPTAAIDSTSTAYQAAQVCQLTEDQRGVPRQQSGPCDAGAYEASCDLSQGVNAAVSNYQEFRAAVICHNLGSAGPSDITLLNSIVSPFPMQSVEGGELTIDGGGHTLSRAADGSTALSPLILARQSDLRLIDLDIAVGPYDTAGVEHQGPGELTIRYSSIRASTDGSTADGVVTGADLAVSTIADSTIRGTAVGVRVESEFNIIERSTIESTNTDAVWAATTGLGGILDSTLAGPIGIELHTNGLLVENSTIFGDGAALSDDVGPLTFVTFSSSIVTTCSANELAIDATSGPGWVDLGANVGSCFDPTAPIPLELADFDCARGTPVGCPQVAPIDFDSPAYQAGNCDPTRAGDHDVDQRGEPRTPAGPGCDAGAFEAVASLVGDVTGDGTVNNADVQALLEWLAGGDEPTALFLGDLTTDGEIKLEDALALAQDVAG